MVKPFYPWPCRVFWSDTQATYLHSLENSSKLLFRFKILPHIYIFIFFAFEHDIKTYYISHSTDNFVLHMVINIILKYKHFRVDFFTLQIHRCGLLLRLNVILCWTLIKCGHVAWLIEFLLQHYQHKSCVSSRKKISVLTVHKEVEVY